MKALCKKLGYTFKDIKLLETALTHPSFGGDHHVPHYQRLEFLGDAVLELAISRYLFFEFPEVDEGKLTRIRAGLVREETLCRAARRLELGKFIRLSVGEDRSGGREKPSILCDVMEAVLAAVYLDGGFECAVDVIRRALADELHPQMLEDHLDAKSRLQEVLHGRTAPRPAVSLQRDAERRGDRRGRRHQQAERPAGGSAGRAAANEEQMNGHNPERSVTITCD